MPQFKISCDWEVYATAYVEADNLKQAIEMVKDDNSFPLPTDTNYLDGTFNVDMHSTIALNGLYSVFNAITAEHTLEPLICVHCGSTEVTFNQQLLNGQCGDCGKDQIL